MQDETFKFTRADAVAFIKRQPAGTSFALSIRNDAPVADSETQCYPLGLSTWLNISRAQMLTLAGRMLSETMENKGARIPFSRTYSKYSDNKPTVWIGA